LWISPRGRHFSGLACVLPLSGSILSRPLGAAIMKPEIHPNYAEIKVACSCGNEFTTRSTLGQDLHVEVCSSCHPFYTGKQKMVDSGGRVDKFRKRYNKAAAN
jgi:large subunit ribosomal protein L31